MKNRLLVTIIALSVVLTACGSDKQTSTYYEPSALKNGYEYAAEEAVMDNGASFGAEYEESMDTGANVTTSENATTSNRKLIKTVELTVETKEFDALVGDINSQITALGGYVEKMDGYYGSKYSSYRSEKRATIVARVPAVKLDEFIDYTAKNSNITYRSENVSDVTLDYVDLESHKKMLKEEQERLMEFLEEAETIEDIITIEDRLTNVKYQLDSMESQIRTYDNKIDYSTVTLSVEEVIDYTVNVEPEKTAIERMGEGFVNSIVSIAYGLKEFGVWFVINIPYFILWGIIITVIVLVVRKVRKKNPERKAERLAKKAELKAMKATKKNKAKGPLYEPSNTENEENK